jgi:hypothetical protein
VEFSPSYVLLEPDRGRVTFELRNEDTGVMKVALKLVDVNGSEHLDGRFTTEFASLSPGQALETDLIVWAREDAETLEGQVKVAVFWGADLTMDEEWNPVGDTAEGVWDRTFEVRDEPAPVYDPWVYGLVVVIILVVVAALIHLIRTTLEGTPGP